LNSSSYPLSSDTETGEGRLDNAKRDGKLDDTAAGGSFAALYESSIKEAVYEKGIHRHHGNLS
jgi:hypothetical protein